MKNCFVAPFACIALVGLSACGSSDGGGGGTAGSNGLDFGAVGQELSDAEGNAVTMSAGTFQVGSGPSISDATITVDSGFFNGDLDGTIEIFGETVTITDGVGSLTTGEEVRLTYEDSRSGTYAAAVEASVSSLNDINGEGAYVFGFETNPTTVDARTGSLTYVGDFQATGSVGGSTTQTEYEGGLTVVVNFDSDEADFTFDGVLDGSTDVDLGGDGLDIVGNQISGDLGCDLGCSGSASEVDATFYGPDVDELGGVLIIDVSVTGVGTYDGVGTFVITP
ncbi:hypothetical protein [Yoonia sp. BS5-3]|uniref:Transferrin-binding protein B C-lobe/N-lobe beta barrel domain-containing protein n=1 Tax=Yoonia phaeophyticola TaxID=3137369 RepID=A0ABZ2V1D3_9RHOB